MSPRPALRRLAHCRPAWFAAAALLAVFPAFSQPAPAPLVQDPPTVEDRRTQKVEKLHAEDDSVVIDEIRYAGQTQSTKVTPKKSSLPAYEMLPVDVARTPASPREDGRPASRSVWNVLDF